MKKNVEKIDITFGIPMYNSEKYIGHLLDCFKKNSCFKYEILIIDDGSTDNGVEICKKYDELNIRLIIQKNSGVSATRNKIIKYANGEWITFIDSDDLIIFNSYEKALKELIKSKCDFLINSKNHIDLPILIQEEIINSPCMKIYNLELLRKNNILFNEKISLGEDLIFNLKYYKICKNICFYNKNMYIYQNINNNSLTAKYRKNKFEELMMVNEICKKMFNDQKIINALEYIRIKNCFSCIKSEVFFNKDDDLNDYVHKLKKYTKMEFKLLNNIRNTIVYYLWYLLPSNLLIFISKKIRKR